MSGHDSELEEGEINGDEPLNETPVIATISSAFQDAFTDFKRQIEGQLTRSTLADRNYGRQLSNSATYSKDNFKSKNNPRSSRHSTNKNYKKPAARTSRKSSGGSTSWPSNSRPKKIVRHDDIRNSHSSRKSYHESHRSRDSGTHKRSPRRSSHEAAHDRNHFPESAAKHMYKKSDTTYPETDHTNVIQKSSRRVVEIPEEWQNNDISPSKICRTISNDSYINKTQTASNARTVELQKENDFVDSNNYLKNLKGNCDPSPSNASVDTQESMVLVKPFSNDKDDEIIEIPVVKEKREPELIVIDSSDETEPDQDDGYEELELRKAALEGLFKNLKSKEQVEEHNSMEGDEDIQALRSHLLADMANKTNSNQTEEITNVPDNTQWMKTFKPVNASSANIQTSELRNKRPAPASTTTRSSTVTSTSTTPESQQSHPESSSTMNPLLRPFPRHWVDRKNPKTEAEIREYLHELSTASNKDYIGSLMEAAKHDNMLPVVPSLKSGNKSYSSTKKTISRKSSSYKEPAQRSALSATSRTVEMGNPTISDIGTSRMQPIPIALSNANSFSNSDLGFGRGLSTVHSLQTQSSVREAETNTFYYGHVSPVPILQPATFIPQSVSEFQGQPLFPRVSDTNRFVQPPTHLSPCVRPPGAGILGSVPTAFITNSFQAQPPNHLQLQSPVITNIPNGRYSNDKSESQNAVINPEDMRNQLLKQRRSRNINRAGSPFCFGQGSQLQAHSIPPQTPHQQKQVMHSKLSPSIATSPTMHINPNVYSSTSKGAMGLDQPKNSDGLSPILPTEKCVVNSLVKSNPASSYHKFLSDMIINGEYIKDKDDSSENKPSDDGVVLQPPDINLSRANNENTSVVTSAKSSNPRVGNLIIISCPDPEIENESNKNKDTEPTTNGNICKIDKQAEQIDIKSTEERKSSDDNKSCCSSAPCPIPTKKSTSLTQQALSIKTEGLNEGTKTPSAAAKDEIMKPPSTTNTDVQNPPQPTVKVENALENGIVTGATEERESSNDNESCCSTPTCLIPTKKSTSLTQQDLSIKTEGHNEGTKTPNFAVKDKIMNSQSTTTADVKNPPQQNVKDGHIRKNGVVASTPLTPAAPLVISASSPVLSAHSSVNPVSICVSSDSSSESSVSAPALIPAPLPPVIVQVNASISPLSTSSISKNAVVPATTTPTSSSVNEKLRAKFIPSTSSTMLSRDLIKGTEAYKRKLAHYDHPMAVKRTSKFRTNNTNSGRNGSAPVAFKQSKPMARILISLNDDSSSDEDTQTQISATKNMANTSGGKGSSSAAASLPANFNVKLDAMLKSAREKAQSASPQKFDEIINNSHKEIKDKTEDASNKSDARNSKQSTSTTSPSKPDGENAREKEELELRERLLRATLMNKMKRSQTQLQLFSNEKKLVNTRASTTDMFQQLHSSMIKFKEKRNMVKESHQKMQNLRKQLETEEKRYLIAKKSANVIGSEVKQRSVNAFRMRKVCLDLKKTCSEIGAQVSGSQYKLPVQGEAGLNAIVADVRKQTSIMKELNESSVDNSLTPVGSPKPMPASNSSSSGIVSQLSTSTSSAVRNLSYVIDITPSNDSDPPHPEILTPSTSFLNILGISDNDEECGPPPQLPEAFPVTFTEYESPLTFNKSKGKN